MSEQKNKNDWSEREVGALWKKQSSTQKFLSGHIKIDDGMGGEETLQVVIFNNKHKQKDNHPDFRIYKSIPRTQPTTSGQTPPAEDVGVSSGVQEVSEEDVL
jgi:uncharacterized protein (DUF736 family)